MGGVRIAVLAAVVSALVAAGVTRAQPARVKDSFLNSRAQAVIALKGRFPNIRSVDCLPDRKSPSRVIGTVREWNRYLCNGTTRQSVRFSLALQFTGKCLECWTITNLKGTIVADLRRGGKPASAPKPPSAGSGDWYWSESLADDRVSHSLWITNHSILDPNTVDCGGYGSSIAQGGTLEYKHFRCRIYWNSAYFSGGTSIYVLYQLTVTRRDVFTIVKLKMGVG